jgi:hypothetical protein
MEKSVVNQTQADSQGNFRQPASKAIWGISNIGQVYAPGPFYWLEASTPGDHSEPVQIRGGQIKPLGLGADNVVNVGNVVLR